MKGVFGQRAEFLERSKHEAAVQKALVAMRQLGLGIVFRCHHCGKPPYEAEDNSYPCSHERLYDKSLRGFGLDAMNAAARILAKEKASE